MAKSMKKSPSMASESTSRVTARDVRESALNEARQTLIVDAARSAFFELGLNGASLREIAKRAGYSPGAIYSYFKNREEIYAALLDESLDRLKKCVDDACPKVKSSDDRTEAAALLQAKAMAFFAFYHDNPQDMDLGFYLFNGAQPRGLTPQLNQQLNEKLLTTLLPVQETLVRLGLRPDEAVVETTAIFAHVVGLLMLNNTGRIRLFQQQAQDLFVRYLDELSARLAVKA